jgi:hypothetical protein
LQRTQVNPSTQKPKVTSGESNPKSGEDKSNRGEVDHHDQPKTKRRRPPSRTSAQQATQNGAKHAQIFSECEGGPLVGDIESSEETVADVFKLGSDGIKIGSKAGESFAECAPEMCPEFEDEMAEVNEDEEEIFQDLDAVDDAIGEASFTEVEDLFESFM